MFNWIGFLTYASITAVTPGPNNMMSLSNAGRVGFKKALPFNYGVGVGVVIVMLISTVFATFLSSLLPYIQYPMLMLGALYILYLAWQTYKSPSVLSESMPVTGFKEGFLLQFMNPKTYIYCIMSIEIYIMPFFHGQSGVLVSFAILLALIGFVCTVCWTAFGAVFKVLFSTYAKFTNTLMALLLVYCAISLFL